MTLTEDGLVLGAATVLAKIGRSAGQDPEPAADNAGERILALLGVAYRQPVPSAVLGNIRRAGRYWQAGDDCLASIELALTGLPELPDEDEACSRLQRAARLLARGMAPDDLLKTLRVDPAADTVKAGFNPAQPRVPAGNGLGSGRWSGDEEMRAIPIAAQKPPAGAEYKIGDPDKFFDTLYVPVQVLAQRLRIDETWILGLAAYESGWLDQHNRDLDDPFGVTHRGGRNVAYDSIAEAIAYWEKRYGKVVTGAKTPTEFARRLWASGYNSATSDWREGVTDTIRSVSRRLLGWKSRRGDL